MLNVAEVVDVRQLVPLQVEKRTIECQHETVRCMSEDIYIKEEGLKLWNALKTVGATGNARQTAKL